MSEAEPDPLQRTLVIVGGAVLVALAVTVLLTVVFENPRLARSPRLERLVQVKMFVSTFNAVVLLVLTGSYAGIYRDLPNRFTLSLILFSLALFLYAVSSNPALHFLFGFQTAALGPFTFLPDLFAAIATVLLLLQSHA